MNVNEQMNVNEKCKLVGIILAIVAIGKWSWDEIFGKKFRLKGIQPLLEFLAQQGYITQDSWEKTGYSMAKNPSEVYFKELFDSLGRMPLKDSKGKIIFFPAIGDIMMEFNGGDVEYYAQLTLQNALDNMANLPNPV